MANPVAVICENRRAFEDFLGWVESEDRAAFVCVTGENNIRGQRFSTVIRIGTYYKLRGHQDIYESAVVRMEDDQHG